MTPAQNAQKLDNMIQQSDHVVFRASTVFPFTLFPTEIVVDEMKLNIVHHDLFNTGQISSIEIGNITNIIAEVSVLFGTLRIQQVWLPSEFITIRYLKKHDAIEARKIIQGLMVSRHENINLAQLSPNQVRTTIQGVGKTKTAL